MKARNRDGNSGRKTAAVGLGKEFKTFLTIPQFESIQVYNDQVEITELGSESFWSDGCVIWPGSG